MPQDVSRLPTTPMVSRPGKRDCSELALAIYKLAMHLAESIHVKNLDELTAELKKHIPEIEKRDVVQSIVDATATVKRKRSEDAARVANLRREARKESEPLKREKLQGQIDELQKKLESPIDPKDKPEPVPASKELERLAYQRDRLRGQIRQKVADMKPRSLFSRATEPLNLARSVMTSMDVSGVLRQGGFITMGNPVRAAKSFPDMFKAFASEQKAHAIMQEIHGRDNAPLYARSKLFLGELDGPLAKQEEAFMSRLLGKAAETRIGRFVTAPVRGSQRAYTVFLNKLRADTFDSMAASLARNGTPTGAEASAIANYINVATGRAPLGKAEAAGHALATTFFAPRYAVSRFQLLAGQPLYGGTARTRKLIAQEYAKYLVGMGVVYGLGNLAGGELESDPRSSDFGKIKFGDTRLDPLSGLAQTTTLIGRLATGETKRLSGKVVPIRGNVPYGADDSADVIARFLRSKLSPAIGAAVDIASGENVVGEKVTPFGTAGRMMVPLAFQDIYDVMRDEGVPEGTALGILSLFGMGLQHYEQKGKAAPEVDLQRRGN